jgi:hypothetical protein
MAEHLTTLDLSTQPVRGLLSLVDLGHPGRLINTPISLNTVVAISTPDGNKVENPLHSEHVLLFRGVPGEPTHESITLSAAKAARLVALYARLQPGHRMQCHDMVTITEGWDRDMGPSLTQKAVQPADLAEAFEPDIAPGNPYTVQVLATIRGQRKFYRTHSCLGTDTNRLLGIVGAGSVMSTMDPETTRTVYTQGTEVSVLARTILRPS